MKTALCFLLLNIVIPVAVDIIKSELKDSKDSQDIKRKKEEKEGELWKK